MSSLQSTVALLYMIIFILSVCFFTFAAPEEITGVTNISKDISCYDYIMSALLLLADMEAIDGGKKTKRVKRAKGAFDDAASMDGMKVFRTAFSFISNLFSEAPVGGKHPLSRSIPKHFVNLIKTSVVDSLFPTKKV